MRFYRAFFGYMWANTETASFLHPSRTWWYLLQLGERQGA
jgi:hypothetical protein